MTAPGAGDATAAVDPRLLRSLALALHAWEELELEVGEAAVVTGDGPFPRLLHLAAFWRGALPAVHWPDPAADLRFSPPVRIAPDRAPLDVLKEIARAPGFAAVDFGGSPRQIDTLLAAAPRFGRILLAAERMPPLTVDYYNDLHRKGVLLRTRRFDFEAASPARELERARRILENPELRGQIRGGCPPPLRTQTVAQEDPAIGPSEWRGE